MATAAAGLRQAAETPLGTRGIMRIGTLQAGPGAPRRSRLEVYVARHCGGCDEARRLADEVAVRFPDLDVRVIDLADGPSPEPVAAVPTYVMDGAVIALGNPRPEDLFTRLERG